MATLKEIAYDIHQHIRANGSDDDSIDLRNIKYWIRTQRNLWLKNILNKYKITSENIIQDLGSLSLEISGVYKRTTIDLPKFLSVNQEPQIVRVGPVTLSKISKDYSIVPYQQSKFVNSGRFNTSLVSAFLYNNRIYLAAPAAILGTSAITGLTTVNVRGVFEDPLDVTTYGTPNVAFTEDMEYPIDEGFIPYIKGEILKADVLSVLKVQQDPSNNAHNDLN